MHRFDFGPFGPSPWLPPYAAALYLGVALGTLRNWTSARHVPFARRGRIVRYHRDELDEWLREAEPTDGVGRAPDLADASPLSTYSQDSNQG
jgi:excisionase family DNA binding protein